MSKARSSCFITDSKQLETLKALDLQPRVFICFFAFFARLPPLSEVGPERGPKAAGKSSLFVLGAPDKAVTIRNYYYFFFVNIKASERSFTLRFDDFYGLSNSSRKPIVNKPPASI